MPETVTPEADSPDAPVLVIRHGALGDFVLSFGPFMAIRARHRQARITLLTGAPFAGLARMSGWFDEILVDERSRNPLRLWRLRRHLLAGGYDWVYDLQTSNRSGRYLRFWPSDRRPNWSGVAPGCSHPHRNPDRDHMHTLERQREQLADAGIAAVPPADLDWLAGDLAGFDLSDSQRLLLLVPGGSAHRPEKRWPAAHYETLARQALAADLTPLLIGGPDENGLAAAIPSARSLIGETDFPQLASLARRAVAAVGNDTGPMHLLAAAGAPSLTLFSNASDPALCAPRGPAVEVLQQAALADLSPQTVWAALEALALSSP